ncbi:MAG: trypsin-like peptidase domain-containing protein [Clostridiales bacterium]|nr:trypsin-like peptidase domain-containing protein [Clostridiales bacterium]MDY4008837.1 trypsin-like peptidase domain-containing protein [Candidatus Limiplasma sp.]
MKKKNLFGYVAITLALAMMIVTSVAAFERNSSAGAEAVTISENATIVTSPFTDAVRKVQSSVVGVNNYTTYNRNNSYYGFGYGYGYGYGGGRDDQDTSRQVLQGSGSGVVVAKGYVLTNYHVVEDATMLEVTSGDKVYPAKLMGTDATKDIAVMYVEDLDIEPVVLGDSDKLSVGDWAICIGNPLSFTGTTTVGVISALNREVKSNATDAYGKRATNTMIQTDAAINAGNSGGGMFNVAGELVGVPSMKYTGSVYSGNTVEGIGMAIPINEAKQLINNVLAGNGNVSSSTTTEENASSGSVASSGKPRIGVTVTNLNTNNYAVANGLIPTGAYVKEVEAGSPAEKAGIQVADIVVEVDGTVVTTTTQMVSLLQQKQAGDTVNVKVYRIEGGLDKVEDQTNMPEGEYIDLKVELAMLDDVQQ